MPKGKRKGRNDRRRVDSPASDDDSGNENDSVTSSVSDIHSVMEEGETVVDETVQIEDFEDQVKDAIDGATQKSAKGRETSLKALVKAFSNKLIQPFIITRYSTLTDVIERCLKKGGGDEQGLAATLGVLLCVQLGPGPETEEIFQNLKPILITILADNTASPKGRAKCAMALGLCTFIVINNDPITIQEIMRSLEAAFRGSYFKGDGTSPTVSVEISSVHSSALLAWSLLLTIAKPFQIAEMVNSHLSKLPELLESTNLELRIAAGETIALFYELARYNESFEEGDIDELCIKLKQLATDSHKYRTRKDRKQQRSSFRDILQAVEGVEDADGKSLSMNIKFGRENVELDDWSKKRQYDAFCSVLGSGMNHHLTENELLRNVFSLGDRLNTDLPITRITKGERHFANMAAFKSRTIIRNKFRDKRSAVLN